MFKFIDEHIKDNFVLVKPSILKELVEKAQKYDNIATCVPDNQRQGKWEQRPH